MMFRIFLVFGSILLANAQAWACSCVGIEDKTVGEHIYGDLIFVGRPINSRYEPSSSGWENDVTTTFEIDKVLQGEAPQTVEIRHGQSGASCGVQFVLGEVQLISAHETDEILQTGLCSNPLPEMLIVNYFEKHEDPQLKSHWKCEEERLFEGGGSDSWEKTALTPECDIYTLDGKQKSWEAWQGWLEENNLTPKQAIPR